MSGISTERALEQEVRAIVAGTAPSDAMTEVLYEIWQRAIYAEGS